MGAVHRAFSICMFRSPHGCGAVLKLDEAKLLELAGLAAEFPDATFDELREPPRRRRHVSVNAVWRGLLYIRRFLAPQLRPGDVVISLMNKHRVGFPLQ